MDAVERVVVAMFMVGVILWQHGTGSAIHALRARVKALEDREGE